MIVVQVQIEVTSDRISTPIHVLAREDATDHERIIAHAIEQWLIALNEQVTAESDTPLDVTYIGPQHEAERARDELVKAALTHAQVLQTMLSAVRPVVVAGLRWSNSKTVDAELSDALDAALDALPADVRAWAAVKGQQ
jgi:hypothetical protein